jgi:hypothetical protein
MRRLSACRHGLWNVGVYPEKGVMSQFRQKVLDSVVVTTWAESILVTDYS